MHQIKGKKDLNEIIGSDIELIKRAIESDDDEVMKTIHKKIV